MRIILIEHVGLGLIVSCPSRVIYQNQTGGYSCLASELEGIFVPLRNSSTYKDHTLISPENELSGYFTGSKWRGTGAVDGIVREDADFIDSVLKEAKLYPPIQTDRSRLAESHEAWIFVKVLGDDISPFPIFSGFGPFPQTGVLTWTNSD